jgi:hypothetical protein
MDVDLRSVLQGNKIGVIASRQSMSYLMSLMRCDEFEYISDLI